MKFKSPPFFIPLTFFFSSCATVTIPVAVTLPPAMDISSYHQFAFGEIDGNAGAQFKNLLMSWWPRNKNFSLVSHDRMEVLAAAYALSQVSEKSSPKTERLDIELEGSAFISGAVNKDYYESLRQRPDVCIWKNQSHPCPLRTRVGDVRIGGHIDFADARTGKTIRSQMISKVCEARTQAKNATPGAINRGVLESQCVNTAVHEFLFLLTPSQKLFYPDFVKVSDSPDVRLGIIEAEAGRMGESARDFKAALKDVAARKTPPDKKSLSAIYWDAGLAEEYSWQFDQSLASFKRAYDLSPRKGVLREESQLLNLETQRRRLLGVTPLMLASNGGAWRQVQEMLRKGDDPNVQDSFGNTALMGAVRKGDAPIVKMLLGHGAWVGIKNNQGLGAIDMTRDPGILSLLKGPAFPANAQSFLTQGPAPVQTIESDVDKPSYHEPEDPKKIAFVVGIEHYGNDLPSAEFADHDAEVMRNHLIALGYAPRHIHWLKDLAATNAALVKNLEGWLPRVVDSQSTVFFYYSGHGAADPETRKVYLVPADGDPNYLEETAYPLSKLYADLGKLPAKRVIVALDSCFSGRGARSLAPQGVRPLITVSPIAPSVSDRIAAMTAASGTQIAEVLNSEGHGLFTYYFLKGLNGAAKTALSKGTTALAAGPTVTLQSLYRYLRPAVEDAAGLKNHAQTPEFLPQGILKASPIVLR